MQAPHTPYTLDQLTTFLAVVDEGSFSAAGRRLGRVQSAISYTIGQLEDALGTSLFDRATRTPTLTDAGRRLAAEARLVLTQARELTEVAARLRVGTEPELRVVVDAYYPSERLLSVCAAFREEFPSTALRLEVGLLRDAVAVVAAGNADLGACNLAGGAAPELATAHLGTVHVVPTCAAAHPLARLSAPQRGPLLAQSVQIVHAERAEASADQGVIGGRTWRVTDLGLKAKLIRRGVGWGSLPLELADPWIEAGELVRLYPEPWPPEGHRVSMHAVTRRERPLGRAGQWFRAQLQLDA
ncbi:MAG: LysR family transcriptional regulator [Myxococcales bacterium]|nr:LysR family transcriptional regulator [Myxococcales bacterium]